MKERKIAQICMVVRDIDASMKRYWEILGVGPWDVHTFNPDTVKEFKMRGEPVDGFEYIVALANLGEMQLELIQPVRNVPIYQRFLDQKGEGIHHIKELVDGKDIEATVAQYKQKGIEVTVSGRCGEDIFLYLDTESSLGMIYEIGNCGAIPAPERRYPPEERT